MGAMLLAAIMGMAVSLPAQAQTDVQANIEAARTQCMALPTDTERLACLNAALDRIGSAAVPAPAPAVPAMSSAPSAELGAEQVAARAEGRRGEQYAPDAERAAIVAIRETVPGQMVLELDNGQVWRQLDGDARGLHFVSGDAPVEISRARLGGYRMTLLDQRRILRVERLR